MFIRLGDLRDVITDEHLEQLLLHQFDPDTRLLVPTIPVACSQFAEDCFRMEAPPKRVRKKQSLLPPSQRYEKEYEACKRDGTTPSAKVILACYFRQYLRLFKEEDPEWKGKNTRPAEVLVNRMLSELSVDPNEVVKYVRNLMPRWHAQLVRGEEFPRTRPTIKALFGGSLSFWANRKVYVLKWRLR